MSAIRKAFLIEHHAMRSCLYTNATDRSDPNITLKPREHEIIVMDFKTILSEYNRWKAFVKGWKLLRQGKTNRLVKQKDGSMKE